MKGITLAEVLRAILDLVEGHVFPCPVEIRLGEIQRSGGGATQGGTDRESTGVGKGIEDGIACLAAIPDANTVFTLIQEDALGVTRLETHEVTDATFADLERLRKFRARNQGGCLLFLSVEMFPVGGDSRGQAVCPVIQFRGKDRGGGGQEAVAGKIIEVDPGESVASSVDEAAGIGVSEMEGASKFFRYVYFADHGWYE